MSASGGTRSGSKRGAINHRNRIATPPTISTGSMKSNMPNCFNSRSRAIPTTSKFVDVPIDVDIPPIMVASPIGNMTPETAKFTRMDTPTNIGISNTTIGVLFMNALRTAAAMSVTSSASTGRVDQARPTIIASGCNAPVVSSAFPTISSAQMVSNASLPKPAKKSAGPSETPGLLYGKR